MERDPPGDGAWEHVSHDLLLISANVAGRMWDGRIDEYFTKRISGSEHAFPGEHVCTSGSYSGARCWYQVTDNFQHEWCDTDPYGNFECYNDLVLARGPDLLGGDSGGPVFRPDGLTNLDPVIAKGTITGSFIEGIQEYLIFQDFITATRDFGIRVQTG